MLTSHHSRGDRLDSSGAPGKHLGAHNCAHGEQEEIARVNVFDDIQFYLFNHHHYIDEPADSDRYTSTWVTYPNANFDPEVAHALYQRWTREMLLAEELGFDAIAINEHHQTIYSMQPATSVRAGYLAALTKRVKILVAGVPINLSWPSRVAEEYAMLDVMSG